MDLTSNGILLNPREVLELSTQRINQPQPELVLALASAARPIIEGPIIEAGFGVFPNDAENGSHPLAALSDDEMVSSYIRRTWLTANEKDPGTLLVALALAPKVGRFCLLAAVGARNEVHANLQRKEQGKVKLDEYDNQQRQIQRGWLRGLLHRFNPAEKQTRWFLAFEVESADHMIFVKTERYKHYREQLCKVLPILPEDDKVELGTVELPEEPFVEAA